jgi:LmbE family N-acetylglucosaminyl deacetylase
VLAHATDGEAGQIAAGSGVTRATLAAVRRDKDERAWRTLGRPPDRHEWLGYRDGALAKAPFGELVDRITDLLAGERPDVVLTLGPDGIAGHPDHITIGRATTEAFLTLAEDGGPGLRRLTYGAIRQSVIDRWTRRRVPPDCSHGTRTPSITCGVCPTTRSASRSTPPRSPPGCGQPCASTAASGRT